MASISTDKKTGRRTIQFVGGDGKRRSIRLGKIPIRQAEAVKTRVEHLVAASIANAPIDGDTARWLATIDDVLADRLAAVGLTHKRDSASLASFIDEYIDSRHSVGESTKYLYRKTRDLLVEYFGASTPMRDITEGDAEGFREWLVGLKDRPTQSGEFAENTIRRRCGRARQFFRAALKKRLIDENPFDGQKVTVGANPEKFRFVTREESDRILEACPDAQWRLIFVLSRYGGLRCPSEHLALTWVDVDWANKRLHVTSPKTEHCGKKSRVIPLFPEVERALQEAFDEAPDGTLHVITRYRDTKQNLRTHFNRIVKKAGIEPWVKPFQNLRSTRETELAKEFPLHVVTAWIGNSEPVAAKHYLQVTSEDFAKAVQNPVQYVHAPGRKASQPKSDADEETLQYECLQASATTCTSEQLPRRDSNPD